MNKFLFTSAVVFGLITLSQAMEVPDKPIKSVSVQLNLDNDSSEQIFDMQKEMRKLVNGCPEISGHYKHDYKLTYTSAASYPHITIEVFNHNDGGNLDAREAGRLPTLFREGQAFRQNISSIFSTNHVNNTNLGLVVFGTNLKFIVKSQDKKHKPYWSKNSPDEPDSFENCKIEKKYYDSSAIKVLEKELANKDIVSASIVLEVYPGVTGIFGKMRSELIKAIQSDKNMKYFKIAHDVYSEDIWHVTLLKLKAVRTCEQQKYLEHGGEKKGNIDMLWNIPNPFDEGGKILQDLFGGISNFYYSAPCLELFCDKLVTNPMLIKQDAKGSSPEKAPSRKDDDFKNGLDLKYL